MGIEKHYTAHELADLLSLDYETVLRKAQTGEIRSVRIGRLRRFPESAVRDYLERQRDDVVVDLRPRLASPKPEQAE
jgi:excisionase family DNA binding protein